MGKTSLGSAAPFCGYPWSLFDTDYTVYPAKPQEGKLQGVPQAAVQPLFSPLHRAGDGGAVHPQLLSNLGHFQSPVVIEEHHLPLPGRQLLLPGPAQAAPQPLQLLTVILRMVPQPDGHVPDPLAAAGVKACISHVCDSSCRNNGPSAPPAPGSPAAAASAL